MKIFLRILSVGVIVIAVLFLIGYFAMTVGLWQANTPVTSGLTDAFTVVDELLQNADPVLEKTTGILGEVAKIENEISNGQSQTVSDVQGQLTALRANAQEAEQTLTTTIPQVPAYIDFIWIMATLVLIWLGLAQAALIYLAWLYLRTGRLGRSGRAQSPGQADRLVSG